MRESSGGVPLRVDSHQDGATFVVRGRLETRIGCRERSRTHFPFNGVRELVIGGFEIVRGLKIQPEAGAGVEVRSPPQSRIRSNAAAFVNDFTHSRHADAEIKRQPIHAEPQRLHELGAENLTRMDWRQKFLSLGHFMCSQRIGPWRP
jgi:hypothetical protein